MMPMQMIRSGGQDVEPDTSSPRVYFLTDSKFYELVFSWSDPEGDHRAGKEMSEWQATFLSALHELPMTGFELMMMTDNVHDGGDSLLYISSRLRESEGMRCEPTRVSDLSVGLPKAVLFVVPCFTTQEIHDRIAAEGFRWHYKAYRQFYKGKAPQPPQPASDPLTGEDGAPFYDVMPMSRSWSERIAPKTRLRWPEVLELIRQADDAGGCIALRYYAELPPPEGEAYDSLEWLNAARHLLVLEAGGFPTPPASGRPAESSRPYLSSAGSEARHA